MMGQHESHPTTQKVTGKCILSYVMTILSYKIRIAYSKIEMHGVAGPVAEDGLESERMIHIQMNQTKETEISLTKQNVIAVRYLVGRNGTRWQTMNWKGVPWALMD